jgi:hypothetical protein
MLGSFLVARVLQGVTATGLLRLAVAGALVGFAASIKIWGVLVPLVLAGWYFVAGERRRSGAFLAGSVAGCAVICLPFFLRAPRAMWEMVVSDQLGRRRADLDILNRLNDLAGLSAWGFGETVNPLLVLFILLAGISAVLAWIGRAARPVVILTGFMLAMLMVTPFWFLHYACLVAAPFAMVLGAGGQQLYGILAARTAWGAPVMAVVILLGSVIYNYPTLTVHAGREFAGPALRSEVADLAGCMTSDDPMALVQMNVLSRDIKRGCRFMVDLGGQSYHRSAPEWANVGRTRNRAWQAYALNYLRSGSYSISVRFAAGRGYSRATAKTISRWPVAARAQRWVVRIPQAP